MLQRINLLNMRKRLGRQGTCHSQARSTALLYETDRQVEQGKGKGKRKGKKIKIPRWLDYQNKAKNRLRLVVICYVINIYGSSMVK